MIKNFLALQKKLRATNADYKKLCETFDARDNFYKMLREFFSRHGYIPKEHEASWQQHMKDMRPWRKIPGMRFAMWVSCFRGSRTGE
jgi:hypothetical protein